MRSRLVLTSLALLGLTASAGCADEQAPLPRSTQPTDLPGQPTPSDPTGTESSTTTGGGPRAVGTLVDLLEVPWGLDFLPDGAAVVTERMSGRVLHVTPDGTLTPLGAVPEAVPEGEAGLLGVAVSPDFESDSSLFFYITTGTDNRVLRAELDGMTLGVPEVVFAGIPQGFIHDGGRIAFGPDGYLYVATGETGDPELAQDPNNLGGKILRLTPDGDPAPGNPEADSPVWTLGHRNVQGLAWDDQGRLWASEFGASAWDELNLIERGGNYGWPEVEGTGGGAEFIDPQIVWPVENASPSGLTWADGHLWMAGLRGQRLWRINVSRAGTATDPTEFFTGDYGRLRTVMAAPDGTLWLTTSNQDGRGDPIPTDDRIIVIQP